MENATIRWNPLKNFKIGYIGALALIAFIVLAMQLVGTLVVNQELKSREVLNALRTHQTDGYSLLILSQDSATAYQALAKWQQTHQMLTETALAHELLTERNLRNLDSEAAIIKEQVQTKASLAALSFNLQRYQSLLNEYILQLESTNQQGNTVIQFIGWGLLLLLFLVLFLIGFYIFRPIYRNLNSYIETIQHQNTLLEDSERQQKVRNEELNALQEDLSVKNDELKLLSLVARETDNAVIITDKDGKIMWANQGFTTISGYTFAEVQGRKPGTFLQGPDTNPEHIRNIRAGLQSGKPFTQEILNYSKQGVPYWLSLHIAPVYDAQDRIEKFVAIELDVTERKQAEQLLVEQRERIEDLLANTTASINYARRIQHALLPNKTAMQRILGDYFVFYRPKDIVSGDFYWFHETDTYTYFAVADCTGHGVPGAFMSMIGIQILNKIAAAHTNAAPAKMLELLQQQIHIDLQQEFNSVRDGMDIAICRLDKQTRELTFASAMRPLYYVHNQTLHEIKGDKQSIGGWSLERGGTFTNHHIAWQPDTVVYLCTDGYKDQFGGAENTKFKTRAFKELLTQIAQQPLAVQQDLIEDSFSSWKGRQKQTDDVLVVGWKW